MRDGNIKKHYCINRNNLEPLEKKSCQLNSKHALKRHYFNFGLRHLLKVQFFTGCTRLSLKPVKLVQAGTNIKERERERQRSDHMLSSRKNGERRF